MLFLTVYGPELESIFTFIYKSTRMQIEVTREQIYEAYLPQSSKPSKGQTKNIEDALGFLKAAHLIQGDKLYSSCISETEAMLPFPVLLLRQFRLLEQISLQLSPLDLLYIRMLDCLFISPNQMWVSDLHTAVNQLDLAQQVGGVSQEKVGAWKRVMEFLGVGYRISNGFYCLYQPELINVIARQWTETEGDLQDFIERHLQQWIPCLTARSEIAFSTSYTLEHLVKNGSLSLFTKQDSPSRPYFGNRHLRGIKLL